MRSGYYKVDETPINAMFVFPCRMVGNTPAIELRQWLDVRGIREPIVYCPTVERSATIVIPITEAV